MWTLLHRRKLSSSQIILVGFALVILLGTLVLMLPISANGRVATPFLDCLFTATSAVCVTGLVVHDTVTHWSLFGQTVILILIQIGGMGVVTVAAAIAIVSGRKISLMQRSTMQDAVSAHQVGGIVRFTDFILKGTFLMELLGAAVMAPVFIRDFGFWRGCWMAVFHAVSAFCNAGFDLMGSSTPFSSLTRYVSNPIINIVITGLILLGGLGFLTWQDIRQNRFHVHRYRMQSKVILVTTGVLLVLPTLYLYFFELNHLPFSQRLWGAWFQAVTPRTAGFNTLDFNTLSETGQMLTAMLMLVGGSPGSTAGGMKTTTLAVAVACAAAVVKKRESGQFFGRRVEQEAIKNAFTVFLLYMALFFTGGMCISRLENLPLLTCLFESASAVGTVGLTLGITPGLGTASRMILIALMFTGRVGGLTLIYATMPAAKNTLSRLPLEKITVG